MKFFNIKDTLSIIFTIFCCLGFFIASSDASRKPKSDLNEDWTLFKKSIRKSYKNLKDDLERFIIPYIPITNLDKEKQTSNIELSFFLLKAFKLGRKFRFNQ